MRTAETVVRVERASVRLASRCGGARSIRPRRCAASAQRYTTMWSKRPSARGGSQIARLRTPRARQKTSVR
eukprot:5719938-Lingulodinium_polyedra.AAC.1